MAKLPIGRKLRYFRERAGRSQLDVELEADMASGSLSRIESSSTNPQKETLEKLSKIYGLTMRERSYLDGALAEGPTGREIALAKQATSGLLRKPGTLGYLVDERYIVHDISDTLSSLLGRTKEEQINIPLVKYIFDDTFNLDRLLNEESIDKLLLTLITRLYFEMGFMKGDPLFIRSEKEILSNPRAKSLWEQLNSGDFTPQLLDSEDRTVTLEIGNQKIDYLYSVEAVLNNDRFDVIEYKPTSSNTADFVIDALSELSTK